MIYVVMDERYDVFAVKEVWQGPPVDLALVRASLDTFYNKALKDYEDANPMPLSTKYHQGSISHQCEPAYRAWKLAGPKKQTMSEWFKANGYEKLEHEEVD